MNERKHLDVTPKTFPLQAPTIAPRWGSSQDLGLSSHTGLTVLRLEKMGPPASSILQAIRMCSSTLEELRLIHVQSIGHVNHSLPSDPPISLHNLRALELQNLDEPSTLARAFLDVLRISKCNDISLTLRPEPGTVSELVADVLRFVAPAFHGSPIQSEMTADCRYFQRIDLEVAVPGRCHLKLYIYVGRLPAAGEIAPALFTDAFTSIYASLEDPQISQSVKAGFILHGSASTGYHDPAVLSEILRNLPALNSLTLVGWNKDHWNSLTKFIKTDLTGRMPASSYSNRFVQVK